VLAQFKPVSLNDNFALARQTTAPIGTFVGRYVNSNYGYSFLIPDAFKAISDPPPSPQHGVLIPLSEDARASIFVGGSYNSEEYRSASEAVDDDLKRMRENGSVIASSQTRKMRLGGLPAKRSIVHYRTQASGEKLVQDLVVCIRKEKNKESVVYEIYLSTPEKRYGRDRHILDRVLHSWKNEFF